MLMLNAVRAWGGGEVRVESRVGSPVDAIVTKKQSLRWLSEYINAGHMLKKTKNDTVEL